MMQDADIWLAAKAVLDRCGSDAQLHASRRISDLTMQGNQAEADLWSEILAAIIGLKSREPPDSIPR